LTSVGLTPSDWHARDEDAVEQLRRSGSTTPFEKEYLRRDGSRLPVVLGLVLMEGTDTIVGFVLDRTEQKVAEEKLKNYAAALEGANRELESFSYSVAHDLRAPLRSIDGFSQALLEDYADKLDDGGGNTFASSASPPSTWGNSSMPCSRSRGSHEASYAARRWT
jgi:signal transduction histidine kinase